MVSVINNYSLHLPFILSSYQLTSGLFYFTVYSFFGWILENSYNLLTARTFLKANFFKGPFKPMYGIAPVLLVFFITEKTNWMVIIILCFFVPTMVEYVSGAILHRLFHRKWWDYSGIPLQLQGHICLPFSLCWLLLSIVCIKFLHPVIILMYRGIEPYWSWLWPIVCLYFIMELLSAIRRHSSKNFQTEEPTNSVQ